MLSDHIKSQIYTNFGFEPTFGQQKVIESFAEWIISTDFEDIFILNGHAGTGKTSLISALVKTLKTNKISSVLLAPTGRAAKVLGSYTGEKLYTIHKKIYRQKSADLQSQFTLDLNRSKDTCFIIDEASMLSNHSSDGSVFGSGSLLEDVIKFVRSGARCRLMIVGDNAQLPPIGHDRSPALDPDHMKVYGPVTYTSLDEVMRQSADSGILFNATMVRCMLEAGIYQPPLFEMNYPDIKSINGGEFLELVEECYDRYGKDETIVITRSNKRANRFNEGIRRNVMYAEEEIESGDMLMVVKNNYHYTDKQEECPMEFIANGDTARLVRIRKFETLYGLRFAQAQLVFDDYDKTEIDCKIILDTLSSESPSLTSAQSSQLFFGVNEDFAHIKSKAKRYKEVRENEHYNAVQVKFAYAVTCHKAQGGQWSAVFVDRMLFGDEQMTRDMMRWLYTAMTRASQRLYLVNFGDEFFETKPSKD